MMSPTKTERYNGGHSTFEQRKTQSKTAPKSNNLKSQIGNSSNNNNTVNSLESLMLPDDMEPLDNQVAGHMFVHGKSMGMFKHKDEYILKPMMKQSRGEREHGFYEELQSTSDPILKELRHFVPKYYGIKTIPVNGKDIACLMLDNITKGMKEPCIIDIKVGHRTWDPVASALKIQKETKKYAETKRDVGFCIPGFQVRNIQDGQLYKYGKEYGRKLNGETIVDALKMFLNADSGLCRPLLVQLLGLLWRILHWCRRQCKLRLYSSSLLLVYDARFLRHYLQNGRSLRNPNQVNNHYKVSGIQTLANVVQSNSSMNNNCSWNRAFGSLQRTHSLDNNYDEHLENLKQNYVYMLDDLVDDSSNLWANVKMIDFAHAFPADTNTLDTNYLVGIENLIKIFENFLQESV